MKCLFSNRIATIAFGLCLSHEMLLIMLVAVVIIIVVVVVIVIVFDGKCWTGLMANQYELWMKHKFEIVDSTRAD